MSTTVRRFHELDALRGLAAASVVILHFVDMFYPYDLESRRTPAQKILLAVTSPFYRGHEAVMLFFVLSGFVLALPYLKGSADPVPTFLLRRVIRIYFPYLAALGLAVLGAAIWHGHLYLGDWAEVSWTAAPDWRSIVDHILFIGNYNWLVYNRVFWSLVVEMRVSLIFPLLAVLITRLRAVYSFGVAISCIVLFRILIRIYPGYTASLETILYVSVFIVGIVLAQNLQAIDGWYGARSKHQRRWLAGSVLLAFFCGHLSPHASQLVMLYGAVGAILLAIVSNVARTILGYKLPRFLGRISYSLYLVHLSVLYILTFTLHTKIRYTLLFGFYIAAALAVATLFYNLIEQPCIDLSRAVSRRSAKQAISV